MEPPLATPLLSDEIADTTVIDDRPPLSLTLSNVSFKVRSKKGAKRPPPPTERSSSSPPPAVDKRFVQILRHVTASFESGTVTALLGPSGAGKTSLLSILGGHAADWGSVDGRVAVNGRVLSNGLFRKLGALVPQDDTLLPGLTVRQTITFGAALRLKLPRAARLAKTDALLGVLGLTSCADVLVGAAHVGLHGVSGGQRKRTSIALELLADPLLLLLDEPTSGLDSKMAEDVAELLAKIAKGQLSAALERSAAAKLVQGTSTSDSRARDGEGSLPHAKQQHQGGEGEQYVDTVESTRLSRAGSSDLIALGRSSLLGDGQNPLMAHSASAASLASSTTTAVSSTPSSSFGGSGSRTVVCTIHQPSYRIFAGFDQVILLARPRLNDPHSPGRVAFIGRAEDMLAYLNGIGLACPPHENPADHAMRLLQEQPSLDALFASTNGQQQQQQQGSNGFGLGGVEAGEEGQEYGAGVVDGYKYKRSGGDEEDQHRFPRSGPSSTRDGDDNGRRRGRGRGHDGHDSDRMAALVAELERGSFPIGYGRQFLVLLQRFAMDYFRDPQKFVQGLCVRCGIGVVLGVVWWGQAGTTQDSIFPVQGALFACCLNGTMDTVFQTALLVPNIKPLLLREFRNGYYALLPMQLALYAVNALAQNLNIAFLAVPVYTMVGLQPNVWSFLTFLGALSCLVWLGVGVGIAVGAHATTFQEAQAAVVPLLVPLILFSGYLIPYAQIPPYFRFLYEASFFQHAIAILEINQFSPVDFTDCPYTPDWSGKTAEHVAVDPNDPTETYTYTCAGVFNETEAIVAQHHGKDNTLGILETCASVSSLCYDDGDAFLHDMHVNPDSLPFNFYVILIYVGGSVLLGYVLLCRALQTHILCCFV